ncbi:hypothetical protein WGH24286_00104 [Periweissella ghanensis]|uniref:LPXTG cell wall anchor domain-containing protein n=1 Tax=Periweissella ghanensis TaxID=467997 RepID=A0ABN8BIY1_9LACO|nr:hypothetical protein WGH24286_00104 [Periweissella ghanensis]
MGILTDNIMIVPFIIGAIITGAIIGMIGWVSNRKKR